jgi:hypothetical protein
VEERTGHTLDEVSEADIRQAIADEQLETFRRADEIVEAVRRWTIA